MDFFQEAEHRLAFCIRDARLRERTVSRWCQQDRVGLLHFVRRRRNGIDEAVDVADHLVCRLGRKCRLRARAICRKLHLREVVIAEEARDVVLLVAKPGNLVDLDINAAAGLLCLHCREVDAGKLRILDLTVVVAIGIAERKDLDRLFLCHDIDAAQIIGVVADDLSHADRIVDVLDRRLSALRDIRLDRKYQEGIERRYLDRQRLCADMRQLAGEEYALRLIETARIHDVVRFFFIVSLHFLTSCYWRMRRRTMSPFEPASRNTAPGMVFAPADFVKLIEPPSATAASALSPAATSPPATT